MCVRECPGLSVALADTSPRGARFWGPQGTGRPLIRTNLQEQNVEYLNSLIALTPVISGALQVISAVVRLRAEVASRRSSAPSLPPQPESQPRNGVTEDAVEDSAEQ